MSTARQSKASGVRFEPALYRRIATQARANRRSFSGEVLYLIDCGLKAMERDAATAQAEPRERRA